MCTRSSAEAKAYDALLLGAGRPQTRRPSSAKRRLRQVECRARFLELRLKELAAQEEHYQAELHRLQQQEQQLAADQPVDVPPKQQAEALVAPAPELKQEPAAEEGILSGAQPSPRHTAAAGSTLLKSSVSMGEQPGGLRRSQRRRKQEHLHAGDLVPPALLQHPMFAAMAGVRNPAKVGHPCICNHVLA